MTNPFFVGQCLSSLIQRLNSEKKYSKVTVEDIAHLSLGWEDFSSVLDYVKRNTWVGVNTKRYCGILLWENTSLPSITFVDDLKTRIAWKFTGNTKDLFKDYGG